MSFLVETYDPSEVGLYYARRRIAGFADGTFIKASRAADNWLLKVGAQGDPARARNLDRSGEVEVSLLQTSPSNDELSALAVADDLGPSRLLALGITAMPIEIRSRDGIMLVGAAQAWVKKLPDISRGKEVETVTWVFQTGRFEVFNPLSDSKPLLGRADLSRLVNY